MEKNSYRRTATFSSFFITSQVYLCSPVKNLKTMNNILIIAFLIFSIISLSSAIFCFRKDIKRKRRRQIYVRVISVWALQITVLTAVAILMYSSEGFAATDSIRACATALCLSFTSLWAAKLSPARFPVEIFPYVAISSFILCAISLAVPGSVAWITVLAPVAGTALCGYVLFRSYKMILNARNTALLTEMAAVFSVNMIILCTCNGWIPFLAVPVLESHCSMRYVRRKNASRALFVGRPSVPPELQPRIGDEGRSEKEIIKDRFISYLTESKDYLKSDLRINDVANKVYTNKTYLSKVIKDCMNQNFLQVIHFYRIQEAIDMYMKDPTMSAQELCDKSGFNSMSSFSAAFKFNTGMTPGSWCRGYKQKLYESDEED